MTATQNQELADIFNRVKEWPMDMRITLGAASWKRTRRHPSPNLPERSRSIRSSAS